jgi:hypothetical protein
MTKWINNKELLMIKQWHYLKNFKNLMIKIDTGKINL